MRVLVAFDKFKDSLTAPVAGSAVAAALARLRPDWTVDLCPLADGGEGFAGILTRAAGGEERPVAATGPCGEPLTASFGLVEAARIPAAALRLLGVPLPAGGRIAIAEMASASGLALVPAEARDARGATSFGTGEVLRAAAAAGPAAVLLGVGGSATHDLGLGALSALGLSFLGAAGDELGPVPPARWPEIRGFRGDPGTGLPPILIACDVENPLLGPEGALATYGPQKGLRPADQAAFEEETARLARLLCRHFGRDEDLVRRPGAGAAGGIAFGLMAAAGARLLPGLDLVGAWLDLEARMAAADVVITGEGRFDATSLSGKGPGAVVRRALALGKEVHVFAGQVQLRAPVPGLLAHAISPPGLALAAALSRAEELLGAAVGRVWPPG